MLLITFLNLVSLSHQSGDKDRKGAWPESQGGAKHPGLQVPATNRPGGSVQVVISTNGELAPAEDSTVEKPGAPPINTPEVEVVEETK